MSAAEQPPQPPKELTAAEKKLVKQYVEEALSDNNPPASGRRARESARRGSNTPRIMEGTKVDEKNVDTFVDTVLDTIRERESSGKGIDDIDAFIDGALTKRGMAVNRPAVNDGEDVDQFIGGVLGPDGVPAPEVEEDEDAATRRRMRRDDAERLIKEVVYDKNERPKLSDEVEEELDEFAAKERAKEAERLTKVEQELEEEERRLDEENKKARENAEWERKELSQQKKELDMDKEQTDIALLEARQQHRLSKELHDIETSRRTNERNMLEQQRTHSPRDQQPAKAKRDIPQKNVPASHAVAADHEAPFGDDKDPFNEDPVARDAAPAAAEAVGSHEAPYGDEKDPFGDAPSKRSTSKSRKESKKEKKKEKEREKERAAAREPAAEVDEGPPQAAQPVIPPGRGTGAAAPAQPPSRRHEQEAKDGGDKEVKELSRAIPHVPPPPAPNAHANGDEDILGDDELGGIDDDEPAMAGQRHTPGGAAQNGKRRGSNFAPLDMAELDNIIAGGGKVAPLDMDFQFPSPDANRSYDRNHDRYDDHHHADSASLDESSGGTPRGPVLVDGKRIVFTCMEGDPMMKAMLISPDTSFSDLCRKIEIKLGHGPLEFYYCDKDGDRVEVDDRESLTAFFALADKLKLIAYPYNTVPDEVKMAVTEEYARMTSRSMMSSRGYLSARSGYVEGMMSARHRHHFTMRRVQQQVPPPSGRRCSYAHSSASTPHGSRRNLPMWSARGEGGGVGAT